MPEPDIVVEVDQFLADIVPLFLESRRAEIPTLQTALADGDFETLRRLGHDLKGTGGGYGFDAVTDIGRSLEEAAIAQRTPDVEAAIDALVRFLDRVKVVYV